VSCVDEKDRPHYEELLRLLSQVDGWVRRIDPAHADRPQEPPSGSPLRGDDERTRPYQLSHAAWHSLSHAVDHLNCLHALLRDAHMIHMFAPYSLVRSALENASVAVWMLQPASRPGRVARRLRFAMVDIRNSEEAKRLTGTVGPRSEPDRIDEVRDIARRAGVKETEAVRRVGYKEIVNAAGSTLSPGTSEILLIWKVCSGMTHGDFWTTWNAGDRVELPGAPPGVGAFNFEAKVGILMNVTAAATHMTRLGWQLYDQRSSAPY
jgi:hypothetical protein